MREKNMLTKQAVEKLLGEGYQEFCDFTAMDDAAASALSAYKGKIFFQILSSFLSRKLGSLARMRAACHLLRYRSFLRWPLATFQLHVATLNFGEPVSQKRM